MAIDYMDDGGDMAEQPSETSEPKEQSSDTKTALVNSDLCPGMKPGDEFTVRVERVLDSGEYEISYPGEHESSKEEMSEAEPAQASEMDYMG